MRVQFLKKESSPKARRDERKLSLQVPKCVGTLCEPANNHGTRDFTADPYQLTFRACLHGGGGPQVGVGGVTRPSI